MTELQPPVFEQTLRLREKRPVGWFGRHRY